MAPARGGRPVLPRSSKFLGAPLVVFNLRVEELRQVADAVSFGVLYVLHAAKNVLGRLFVFRLGSAKLFLEPEIVSPSFLELGGARIEVQATVLELLAGGL
jgi:hypothetical protein